MLGFLRKHQRYFFVIITIVIVISFSFFGTYSTINEGAGQDPIAFAAVNGSEIPRSELNQFVMFIGTDSEDKLLFGGIPGPNFLNDGVLKKDFFDTGLAEMLAAQYPGEIAQDLQTRHEKEKRYSPYSHPQAQFVSMVTAWNYLAPEIKMHFDSLRNADDASSQEAFKDRVRLYIAEKKLPAPLMRQILNYQQQQYGWLSPDPNLEYTDFSLFGYHTVEDWFGPRFLRLASEFIINASMIAENRGYKVTKDEALADLMHNAEMSFKQLANNPNIAAVNSTEYFNNQLVRMHLDKNNAADIWRKVLLFRRLFQDEGNSVFVDPLMVQKYHDYSMDTAEGELYQLPIEMRLKSFRDLQKFEIYLDSVSKRSDAEKARLALPTAFFSPSEVAKTTPELVQKRYLIELGMYNKKTLESKVGLKETWNWEVEDQNWSALQKQFSDLGAKKASTREERFAVLDGLDDKTRSLIDQAARKAIVNSHPEWLEHALENSEQKRITLGLHLKGGWQPIAGLKNNEELMRLLDKAPLSGQDPALVKYSVDGESFYRIKVIDRTPSLEVLSYQDAMNDDTLDRLLDAKLETYYNQTRESRGKDFRLDDNSWKSFSDVKSQIAELYFEKTLKAIYDQYAAGIAPAKAPKELIADISASLRFYPYMNEILSKAKKDPGVLTSFTANPQTEPEAGKLPEHKALSDQWKLIKTTYKTERGKERAEVDLAEVFSQKPNTWSAIQTPANGDIHLFYLTKRGNDSTPQAIAARVSSLHQLIADEAQRQLMKHVLSEIKEKRAISLDYLDRGAEIEG